MLNKFVKKIFQNSEISKNLGIRSESSHYSKTRPCLRHCTIDKAVRDFIFFAILFHSGFDLLKLISKIKVIAYRLSIGYIWTWEIWFNSYDSCEEYVLDWDRIITPLTMDIRADYSLARNSKGRIYVRRWTSIPNFHGEFSWIRNFCGFIAFFNRVPR